MVGKNLRSQTEVLETKRKRASPSEEFDTEDNIESSDLQSSRKRVRWDRELAESGEEDEAEQDDSVRSEKICLAISCQFGRVGCAYYDPISGKMHVLEDSQESPHYDLATMLLEQIEPDVALTTSKSEDGFIEVLRDFMTTSGGLFQVRPHKDFVASKGRDRMLSLRLLAELPMDDTENSALSDPTSDAEPRSAYDFMRRRGGAMGNPTMQKWHASIRLANYASVEAAPLCLGSIGALMDHLSRVRAVGELDDAGIGGLEIREMQYLTLKQVMHINADALYSLQIFDNESHASVHSDKTKEGLSLFGILNNTKTSLGRALLREWLLRPSVSLETIAYRHDAVSCFVRPDNQNVADSMHSHLQGIKNVPRIIGVMRAGKAKMPDWQGLVKFAYHSVMLRDTLQELSHAGSVDIIQRLSEALEVASFKDIGNVINETIDWEESALAGRVCVRPHIDPELDNLKHTYNGIDNVLSTVAEQLSTTVPFDYAASLNVVYFPQLGYLICVPMLEEWTGPEGVQPLSGWTFQFSSDSHVYFKCQEMHDMDQYIGDLHSSIVDKEIEIIQDLQEKVLVYEKAIGHSCDVCAELDCLLSFAEASRAYDYRRPNMVEENVIFIKQGRHPLQELVVDTFVPNDASIVGGDATDAFPDSEDGSGTSEKVHCEHNSIMVCTGANACGKSVYLKQVAIIQYMAQVGCFVPAEHATLGITDKIFTRIQTRESVSKVQSAFMIDLNQVSLALRNCTVRSLILLDEFGKGTVSADGAGLFCGLLKHFVDLGSACPKILAATHFHDVFKDDILDPHGVPITFVHMQVLFTSSTGEILAASDMDQLPADGYSTDSPKDPEGTSESRVLPGERITYLYKVEKGLWLNSHAAMCAELFGIPRQVVQRARYVSHLLSIHELGQLLDEEMNEEERQDLASAEEVCRRFLAWDFEDKSQSGRVKSMLAEVLGRDEGGNNVLEDE